jgi:hypothetical protein
MAKVKSKEMLMLQDVWRKAFREGGLTIPFKFKGGATRARLQLYNAIRRFKTGEDAQDLEMVHAAEQLEIIWIDDHTIRLQFKAHNDMMESLAAVLGKAVEEYEDPEAVELSKRMLGELEELVEKPGQEPAPLADHQDNPFYGKR